jgi:uncharacterized membrane protein YczE
MRQFAIRVFKLVFGLFLYALGITFTIKANIGYAPWDVFHVGLSLKAGFSIGISTIIAGGFIVALVMVLGEKIGLGTLSNMVLIGVFIDLIMIIDILPLAGNYVTGIIMLVIGLFIISIGSYFYIKSGFGAGPRDSLMVAMNRKTKIPVGISRSIIELLVTIAGWILGGMVGIGTVISVVAVGFCIHLTFAILKFNPTEVQHETLKQTYEKLRNR